VTTIRAGTPLLAIIERAWHVTRSTLPYAGDDPA